MPCVDRPDGEPVRMAAPATPENVLAALTGIRRGGRNNNSISRRTLTWPCHMPNRSTSSTWVRSDPGSPSAVSTSLIKTSRVQLLHMVLPAHHDQPEHHVDDECTIQCLEGDVEVVMPGGTRPCAPATVIVLPARLTHALRAPAPTARCS